MYPQHMFFLRNKKDISSFRMKKVPYLLLWISLWPIQSFCLSVRVLKAHAQYILIFSHTFAKQRKS